MKKWYGLLILVLILSILIPGCTQSTPAPSTSAPSTSKPPVTTTSAVPATSSAPATSAATTAAKPSPSPSPVAAGPLYGGTLKFIRNMGIQNVGAPPDRPANSNDLTTCMPVLEQIIKLDVSERIRPGLAQSVEVSPDGKSITFKLRQGIKFQDGTDFNAAAVQYNFEQVLAKNVAGSAVFKKVTSYDIPDPYTLKMNLSSYDATLLLRLAESALGQIASPTALKVPTTAANAAKDHMIGTGPFKFASWSPDQYVKYVKWDGYWQKGKPYLDAIEYRSNADITVSIMALKAGEVQMVENLDPVDAVALKKAGFFVDLPNMAYIHSICPDGANKDSPFADLRMRQAIEYAIDRKAMADGIGQGYFKPSYQMAGEADGWYVKDLVPKTYDVAKAKQLMTAAGYPNGLTYPLVSDVRIRTDQLTAVQTYLDQAGIKTTLDKADVARFNTYVAGGWKGIMVPGQPNWSALPNIVTRMNDATLGYPSMYRSAGWAAAWDAVVAQPDENKRMAQMQALIKQIAEDSSIIPYIVDAPRYATDGTIMDMKWDEEHMNGAYDPAGVWLKPKK